MLPCSHASVHPMVRIISLSSALAGFFSSIGKGDTVETQRDIRVASTSSLSFCCDVLGNLAPGHQGPQDLHSSNHSSSAQDWFPHHSRLAQAWFLHLFLQHWKEQNSPSFIPCLGVFEASKPPRWETEQLPRRE